MKKLFLAFALFPFSLYANNERELTTDEISAVEKSVMEETGYDTAQFQHNKFLTVDKDGEENKNIYCGMVSKGNVDKFNSFLAFLLKHKETGEQLATVIKIDGDSDNSAKFICQKTGYFSDLEGGLWSYSEKKDEMRNQSKYYASLSSDNKITTSSLNEEYVSLFLRKREKKEDVFFAINKGLFDCDPCTIAIKIDEHQITHLKAERGEGYDTLFILNKKQAIEFTKNMKKGKKMIVELPIYRYGKQQAKFEIKGLKWEHF
ncbi:hypothetical protein [Mannheimia pernigra]|uniref:Uncharacterized protein n=1 Tax=Mannheimia pernigra TaxID=111844 RepID=A0A7D5HTB3_9PAST|nr:hypothetical protein [Mannheimia pernigra]QLB40792.1 hypothetical protein HV559_07870 [Mannheimia pernigra]